MGKPSFYAAHSYMGTRMPYAAPCWVVYAFASKAIRDKFVKKDEYNQKTNQWEWEAVDRRTMKLILGPARGRTLGVDRFGNKPDEAVGRVDYIY